MPDERSVPRTAKAFITVAVSSLANSLGVGGRIYFAGVRRDVERFYRVAHAFVLPSAYEAQPVVCIESLASGLPTIVYDFPGAHELVDEGVNGFIVGTPENMASRVRLLFEDSTKLRSMSAGAHRSAARFHPHAVVERLDAIFRTVVSEKHA